MLTFSNGGRLVQDVSELPDLRNSKRLYQDFETNNVIRGKDEANPHKDSRICGIAVTADDHPGSWYVPIRHTDEHWNLPLANVIRWMGDNTRTCEEWVNHNVKFDANHAAADGVRDWQRIVCTLTQAKLIDSDRVVRGGYGLDALSSDWLEENIAEVDQRVQAFLACLKGPRQYSRVPADIMGMYACQDVLTTRRLDEYIRRRMPERAQRISETEIKMTAVLFDMEQAGMRVDPQELMIREYLILSEQLQIEEELHKLCEMSVVPSRTDDCFELLINRWGLPVLSWTDKKATRESARPDTPIEEVVLDDRNPSFDKDALISYLSHPVVASSEKMTMAIKKMLHYRKINTLLTFFVRPYRVHEVDGVMHPTYNQAVRTGRLSCKRPNAQQLSPKEDGAKALIHPDVGCAFGSADYSQIEYRIICHYLEDEKALKIYRDDPDADFHQMVADWCEISRKPAKNVNFCIGFGGGKKRVISMLASNMELVGSLGQVVDAMIGDGRIDQSQRKIVFETLCKERGEEVFNKYHASLPGLRYHTQQAALVLKSRGCIYTGGGRPRHMPEKAAFRSFNSVVQGFAADIMKDRTVAVAPRYNSRVRSLGIDLRASVHDETLFHGPADVMRDPVAAGYLVSTLEDYEPKLKVPLRCGYGVSDKSWARASSDDAEVDVIRLL